VMLPSSRSPVRPGGPAPSTKPWPSRLIGIFSAWFSTSPSPRQAFEMVIDLAPSRHPLLPEVEGAQDQDHQRHIAQAGEPVERKRAENHSRVLERPETLLYERDRDYPVN